MAVLHSRTISLAAQVLWAGLGGGTGGGFSGSTSYGKSEAARWRPLRKAAMLESKGTGNWRSFWKVRAHDGKGQSGRGRGPIGG